MERDISKDPKVSIVIPVYNGADYIKEAIESALNQTYKNIEIIVVNDGSKDNSEEIIKSYGNKIIYYKKENGGVSSALNLGIKKMNGEYFSWLSHDDRYYPNKIETQINYLKEKKLLNELVITYTNYDVIDEDSNIINAVNFSVFNPNKKPEYALLRGLVSGTALLIPKKAFIDYGGFSEEHRCVQDYLLFFEFMKTYKYIFIDKVTNSTRIHKKQVTRMNPNVIKENNFLWTYMQKQLSNETKIKLEGSLYKFYIEMYKFLVNHNNYKEAQDFALKESEKYLKKEKEKLLKFQSELTEKDFFSQVKQSYKYMNGFSKNNHDIKYEIYKVINSIGIENTINFICEGRDIKDNDIKENYKKIIRNNYKFKVSILCKLNRSLKMNGILVTSQNIYNTIKCKLLSYKFLRILWKHIKVVRKIILFIPKRIILFILNS